LNINYIYNTNIKIYNGVQQTVYVMLGPRDYIFKLLHAKKESKHRFSL